MTDGYQVDPHEVVTCRARLATIQRNAADLATLALDADPDWYIWGLVGAPFAAWYWQFASEFYQHLGQMEDSLAGHVDALDACATSYADTERAVTDALARIHDKLR